MGRPRKNPLPSVTAQPDASAEPVRPQIQQMTGHANSEEMEASLPTNTMTLAADADEAPRRKRRTKAEMEASRAGEVADPLMSDPVYRKHIEKMQTKTGGGIVTGGFNIASKVLDDPEVALNEDEQDDVKGCFYVASKKFGWGLDPSKSPWAMAFYLFGLIGTFIFKRVAAHKADEWTEQFKRWFKPEEEDEPEKKEGE